MIKLNPSYLFVPYRLALHQVPRKKAHLDFFLLKYASNYLYTYELKLISHSLTELQKHPLVLQKKLNLFSENKPKTKDNLLFSCFRKPNHRLLYWHYTGNISKNRGFIQTVTFGGFFYNKDSFSFPSSTLKHICS